MKSRTTLPSLVCLLAAAPAFGAEEHAAPISQLLYPAINFVIFLLLIRYFTLPPAKAYLRGRRESIANTIREAAQEKDQAAAIVRGYRDKLAGLDHETESVKAELRSEGERGKLRVLKEAETLAAKIKSDADLLMDQELKVARQQLRNEMARMAHESAREIVQRHISAADQRRLVEEFIAEVKELK